jgi:hypothetical protein
MSTEPSDPLGKLIGAIRELIAQGDLDTVLDQLVNTAVQCHEHAEE